MKHNPKQVLSTRETSERHSPSAMNAARATTIIFTQSSPLTAPLRLGRFAGVRIIPKTHRFLPPKSPLSSSGQDAWICHLGRANDSDVEGLIVGLEMLIPKQSSIYSDWRNGHQCGEKSFTRIFSPHQYSGTLWQPCGNLLMSKLLLMEDIHSIAGNFKSSSCSHGAFLGSVLGTGIKREKVGDVIVQGENGAQVIIVPELLHFVVSTLDKVGNVPVSCEQIPLEAIEYEPPRTKTFTTVEESLRVDAVASAGYRTSRSYLSQLVSKGDVRVNWNTITKNGTIVRTGDMISVDGKGRLKIGEIRSTKKGKYVIELTRYL